MGRRTAKIIGWATIPLFFAILITAKLVGGVVGLFTGIPKLWRNK